VLDHRLAKRFKHLSKWSRRTDAPCFRVYERDIPEFPLVVDWYDGDVVAWLHPRTRDDTPDRVDEHERVCVQHIVRGLAIDPSRLFIKHRQRQRGLAQYERVDTRGVVRTVREQGLSFEVNLSDYLDTGLFLDHRTTRGLVRARASGLRVLNLFAYTGAFTCHAAAGGASHTRTVDLSNTYLAWARRNMVLNGFSGDAHCFEQADCLQWLEQPTRGEAYDIIVLDPPTFSNSKRMLADSFSVERDWPWLIASTMRWLDPRGQLWFSTNARSFTADPALVPPGVVMRDISKYTLPEDFAGRTPHHAYLVAHAGAPGAVDLRVKRGGSPA
jgi:23S rRNA (cytosine1962-C5)-methyltransferase